MARYTIMAKFPDPSIMIHIIKGLRKISIRPIKAYKCFLIVHKFKPMYISLVQRHQS